MSTRRTHVRSRSAAGTPPRPGSRPWRRRPFSRYALLLLALVAVGGFYAGVQSSPQADAAQGASKAQIDQGRELFQTSCASCHGINGQGTSTGPSLYGAGAAAVDFQVGTGRMPLSQPGAQAHSKAPRFTQAQIDAIAAYIQSLSGGPDIPRGVDQKYSDADLAAGGQLFRANCMQCHNFAGEGGALSNGKYAPALTTSTSTHMYEAMLTGPENMPVFSDQTLTPDEKLSIIKYVKTIKSDPNPGGHGLGRIGPVSEGLVAWLVGIGVCVVAAMWITAKKKQED
ncbi:MAG: c-type cytochrome [Acidothermales bacterium]|nr:c-type cytochrome [Acidothermales bacterium]